MKKTPITQELVIPNNLKILKNSTEQVLKDKISNHEAEDAFYVADLGEVTRQFNQWKELLPRVRPYYGKKY